MLRFLDGLFGVVARINTGAVILAGWAILLITLFTSYSVFMRYFFGRPDTWTYPVSAYLLVLVVFFAAAHALQENVHVRVDYLVQVLPRPLGLTLAAIGDLASTIFLAIFTWQTWRLFSQSLARGRVDETTLAWPLAAFQWVLPAAGVMLLLTHLLLVARRLARGEYGKSQVQMH